MTDANIEHLVIENKSSIDQRKILSRLVLQKIIGSECAKYLRKESYDRVMRLLISEEPDAEINLNFRLQDVRDSYYNSISEVTIKWIQGKTEINDADGNVWVSYTLTVNPTVAASYTNSLEQFSLRADCLWLVNDLVEQITSLVPGPIRVMTLDNDQRLIRDEKNRRERISNSISLLFEVEHKAYRTGLRTGGRSRNVPRNIFDKLTGVTPGTYHFQINEGSRHRPRYKKYTATFPHNESYSIMIKRIE